MASNEDFSSIKAGYLNNYMSQLQSTLFDELGPGKPREVGTYLLKNFGKVSKTIDAIGCITSEIAQRFFAKWKEEKDDEATYGVLKENLRKVNRNDLVKTLNDLGKADNTEAEDDIVLEHVIKKLAPDDLNSMGIHLINDYTAIQQLIKTASPGHPSHPEQAAKIVNYWIKNSSEETAHTLMEAVRKLKDKKLTNALSKLLATIKEELAVAAKPAADEVVTKVEMATDEVDAPIKTVAAKPVAVVVPVSASAAAAGDAPVDMNKNQFPVVPQTTPGKPGAALDNLNEELAQTK